MQCTILHFPFATGTPNTISLKDVVKTLQSDSERIDPLQGSPNVSSLITLALPDQILVHAELGLEDFLLRQEFTLIVKVEVAEEPSWHQFFQNREEIFIVESNKSRPMKEVVDATKTFRKAS